jgi:hypothetical protein
VPLREQVRRRVVAVQPGGQRRRVADVGEDLGEQAAADSSPSCPGVDDDAELAADQQRERVVAHPAADLVGAVAQRQPGGLVQRRDAVGRFGRGGDPLDLLEEVHACTL